MVQELRHRRVAAVGVELEVDVIDRVGVPAPQCRIMALHLVVLEGRDGGEGDCAAGLQRRQQPPNALRERLRVCHEVLVVDVDAVEVVLLDYARQRGEGVVHPGVDGEGYEVDGDVAEGVASEAEGDLGVGVAALEGCHVGRGESGGVPRGGEDAVGGEVRGREGEVDGEG